MRAPIPRTPSAPLHRLAVPLGLVLVGALALAWADDAEAGPGTFARAGLRALADTDSVALDPGLFAPIAPDAETTDSLLADTLDADSAGVDSTERAETYFPLPVRTGIGAALTARRLPGIRGRLGTYWRREVTLDSTGYRYRVREIVGEDDVRAPADVTLAEFLNARRQEALGAGFRELAARRAERQQRRNGLGFAVDIPGGDQSAFSTIFGKNEVALTVNGTSNVNLGARYNENDLSKARNQDYSLAPDFGQELNLNVAGTIGDKLAINVNYDTQSQFDFENQVSLVYTGYEDDIIQRIEAGNVFLQTPATLIRGGQRLFGIRTDLQLGPLALTAVASQQDAETVDRVFEGGTDAQTFRLAPYDYDDNTHFFLGYAFHNWFDEAHERPGTLTPPPGFVEFVGIEVWKHEPGLNQAQADANTTWAVAVADLGEPTPGSPGYPLTNPGSPGGPNLSVLDGGTAYLGTFEPASGEYTNARAPLPNPALDQYSDAVLATVRTNADGNSTSREVLVGAAGTDAKLPARAYSNNKFRRLRANVDYTFDPSLGYVSLTSALTENDQLAVAYQYRVREGDGSTRTLTVGDYNQPAQTDSQTGARTILKLIRSDRPTASDPLWDLTLRNIYRVGGRSLDANNFEFDIRFEPSGATPSTEPRDVSFEQRTFLQVLGLDRVNAQGALGADNAFDFQRQNTVDSENGRIIFPVRQPFGDYFRQLLTTNVTVSDETINVSLGPLTLAEAIQTYTPAQAEGDGLYDLPKAQARQRLPGLSRWRLEGEFSSQSQSTFNIGFNLVEGTVRVTSDGRELIENTDYRVNYTSGQVEVLNPVYLQPGKDFRVSVEQNKFFSIGSKTLLGLRADYRLDEDLYLGATWMRLAERPLGDKFRVGEEALNNSILGVDGSYLAEPRWLTRAIDALPLLQTRAPSRIELRGEFAQLTPGHPETFAFERARDALRDADLDFADDELNGVSYVDDFEGSENAYTALETTGGWRIAAAPDSAGPPGTVLGNATSTLTDPNLKGSWRGLFTWYSITRNSYDDFDEAGLLTQATERISSLELFPERDPLDIAEARRALGLLDLYFDPTRRGPYNFNGTLATDFAARPRDVWGGFTRPIDGSYSDFEGQNNIEFVELLFAPLGGRNGDQPINDGAVLYLDLGQINEDVLPNSGFTNSEDGLRISAETIDPSELDVWGRRPAGQTNGVVDFVEESGRTEDLGIDGLPSDRALVAGSGTPYPLDEREHFASFLSTLGGGAEAARAALDPAADDYYFYEDPTFDNEARYPGGASVQERYGQYLPATELNSAIARGKLTENGRGVATLPNDEDINGNGRTDVTESYHRYAIPLDDAGLRASPFFQNTLPVPSDITGQTQTWYLLRIPVRTERRTTSPGLDRDDFSRIETVRMWTTGHEAPATLRFASLELVGSQWLKSDQIGFVDEPGDAPGTSGGDAPQLFIESINNEENDAIYAIPRGTVQNTARSQTGQIRPTREQALVFRAEGLAEGRRAALIRSYATRPLDLTKYSNLRMDIHGHGFARSDSVYVVVRVGDNESEDYYEFEQPISPFDPRRLDGLPDCPLDQPSNCARADSLWQTNVGPGRVDLNPVNLVLAELNRAKLERDRAGRDPNERFTLEGTPDGAVPGARITVRGQPSIQDVRTIVLGVRNGTSGDAAPLDTVTVWFNELRVTGYDEGGGSSGFLTARIALADVATVDARMSYQQDGFGELGGALGGRAFASTNAFTLSSSFAAHKLLPERFGWTIPVNFSITENASTPRYDPDNGDVRLRDLIADAESSGPDLLADALTADAILDRAQTVSSSRNVRVAASKTGSRSPWLKYTIDGLQASYTLAEQDGSNPSNSLTSSDSWTTNLSYRVTTPKPLTVRPFWFTRAVPVLGGVLGGLQLNVLPQSLSLSADAARRISASRQRLAPEFLSDAPQVQEFRSLTRRTQGFEHGRQMDLRYNPLSFLNLSYASNTTQDLGTAGQRDAFRALVRRTDGSFSQVFPLSATEVRTDPDVLAALGVEAFPSDGSVEILGGSGSQIEVLPFGEAFGNVFAGDLRTKGYTQTLTSALTVSTRRVKWLSWVRPQRISYSANYNWTDQPIPTAPALEVASVGTRSQLRTGLSLAPREFWRLFPFYRKMEEAAGQGSRQPAASDSTSGGGFSPFRLARGVFLAVTGVEDIALTYSGALTAATGGIEGQSYSLFSSLWGSAPPIGYRLGFDRSLGIDRRLSDPGARLTFGDVLGEQHDLDARTTLQPIRGLNIGLNMKTGWGNSENVTFGINDQDVLVQSAPNRRGSGESTVLSFGGSYRSLLERHADRYRDDVGGATGVTVPSEFGSPTGLAEDFAEELARGAGRFGPNGLFAIPLPNWSVTYSGLEKLPLLRVLAQQVTLQHGYSATNQTEYATFTSRDPRTTTVLGNTLVSAAGGDTDGYDEPTATAVNERFQPLIGVNVGWKAGIQTSLTLNRSHIYSLQAASALFSEKTVQDVRVDFSYAKTGLRLLGLRRLNNNIRFTLTALVANDETTRRPFQQDVLDLLAGEEELRDPTFQSTRRIQLSPQISYTISNQVTADLFLRYERSIPVGTSAFPNTNVDGGVNLRILFSN